MPEHIGFVGIVRRVSEDGRFGFIQRATIRREDQGSVGVSLKDDVYVHCSFGKSGNTVRLTDGLELRFLLGPNVRHAGKLQAFYIEWLVAGGAP